MDITSVLLDGMSPFLSKMTYEVLKRELVLIVVDSPENMREKKKIVFPGITSFSEDIEEIDDELIDGVIGIHWCKSDEICIKTDTREIVISLQGKPYVESIT